MNIDKIKIIRDNREQRGWSFRSYQNIEVIGGTLKTADYALADYPTGLSIERKGSVSEIYSNWSPRQVNGRKQSDRFIAELDRLLETEYPFLILEFNAEDLYEQPLYSKLPPEYVWSQLLNYQLKGIQVIFAGSKGEDIAAKLLMKYHRMIQQKDVL